MGKSGIAQTWESIVKNGANLKNQESAWKLTLISMELRTFWNNPKMNNNLLIKSNGTRGIGIVRKVYRESAFVCSSHEPANRYSFWLPMENP